MSNARSKLDIAGWFSQCYLLNPRAVKDCDDEGIADGTQGHRLIVLVPCSCCIDLLTFQCER